MGLDQTVTFPNASVPSWTTVSNLLGRRGFPIQVRMIDGELAFPDETPSESWWELRLGTPGGMVTIRREPHGLVFVTWDNAVADLLQAWNALAWAFAEAGAGQVMTPTGPMSAAAFLQTADLPLALKGYSGEP